MLALAVLAVLAPSAVADSNPYFSAPFQIHTNSYAFGQAPSFTPGGLVLSETLSPSDARQVYLSRLDGSRMRCLTCGRLPGPNGFAAERTQGDWILFCSEGAQPVDSGGPCYGGWGSDLYAMRPDGSHVTRLTQRSDPGGGAVFAADGVAYDNYHPYWSPDGRHIEWVRMTHLPLSQGGLRWEMMLADFVVHAGVPALDHIRVVGPGNVGEGYETQAWAPDGSGFLFTAFGQRSSPYQADPPGWQNLELYFMRVYGRGASPAHPMVTHLSDDSPAWDEQAVFTPDERNVIWMSSRDHPTWYQTLISGSQQLGFDAPNAASVAAPLLVYEIGHPDLRTELYMLDLRTRAIRRLTWDNRVIPEFGWSANGDRMLWTEIITRGSQRIYRTRVATFAGTTAAERSGGNPLAASELYGRPITPMASIHAAPAAHAALHGAVPAADLSYFDLFRSQVNELVAELKAQLQIAGGAT